MFYASTAMSEEWTFAQNSALHLSASAQNSANPLPILFARNVAWTKRALLHTSTINKESSMNKDQTNGRIAEVKGKVKEVAGKIVGNKDLELKGKVQNTHGKVQAAVGDLKADIKSATNSK